MIKFVISSATLLKELQLIGGVLNSSNALPILDDFLFHLKKNELDIYASDIESTVKATVTSESRDTGEVTIPAKLLMDMLKEFADQPLTFIIDPDKYSIEINSDIGKYKIMGHDPEEFPKMVEVDSPLNAEVEPESLLSAINKTIFAVANDDLRPVMSGVYFNFSPQELTFVSTDAHKLVRVKKPHKGREKESSIIVAKKPLTLLKNILPSKEGNVMLDFNKTNASFTIGNIQLVCRLIDGKYPNYEAVIPKENPNRLLVSREQILSSLRRVSILSNKSTHQVKFKIADNAIILSCEDLDFSSEASERLACQYTGDDMEIGFNSQFIMAMLSNLDCDEISLEMSTPNRAGVITPSPQNETENILMLVMPVMLND